ncbi:MAG: hypothetical protein LUG50_15945 [Planctomycetaceae bacterium]|nr:hypothetical protein [Planctomycetaceae bacterium]
MPQPVVGGVERRALVVLLILLVPLMLVAAACRHLAPEYHHIPLRAAAGCLTWLVSFGMSLAAATGIHTRVTCCVDRAGPEAAGRCRAVADWSFILLAVLSFAIGVLVVATNLSRHGANFGAVVYAAIPAGSLLTIHRLAERRRAERERSVAP